MRISDFRYDYPRPRDLAAWGVVEPIGGRRYRVQRYADQDQASEVAHSLPKISVDFVHPIKGQLTPGVVTPLAWSQDARAWHYAATGWDVATGGADTDPADARPRVGVCCYFAHQPIEGQPEPPACFEPVALVVETDSAPWVEEACAEHAAEYHAEPGTGEIRRYTVPLSA